MRMRLAMIAAVMMIAALMRWGVCGESLWVDELHTSWVVTDGFQDVAARAAEGNQTPGYFLVLWFWVQCWGESEWTLRLPAVIASTLTCGLLAMAVWRLAGNVWAGCLAGLGLALQQSSIFYGSEARGYAIVMLATSVVLWGLLERHLSADGFATRPWCRWGSVVAIASAAAVAVAIHVTAAWSMGILAIVFGVLGIRRRSGVPLGWRVGGSLAIAMGVALSLALHHQFLLRTWGVRGQWGAFAVPRFGIALGSMWPWFWGVVLPGLWQLGRWGHGRWVHRAIGDGARGDGARGLAGRQWEGVLGLLGSLLGATLGAWWIADQGFLALWHRRFLIGLLPLVCMLGGWLWGEVVRDIGRGIERRWPAIGTAVVRGVKGLFAGAAMLVLLIDDGTAAAAVAGRWQWVVRGEDWRGAIGYLRSQGGAAELVAVDPGLIEREGSDGYLTSPLRGLYQIGDLERDPPRIIWRGRAPRDTRWLILRGGEGITASADQEVRKFGKVWVIATRKKGA